MNEFVENLKTEVKRYLEDNPEVICKLLNFREHFEDYTHLDYPEFGYFTFAFFRFEDDIIVKVFSGDMLKNLSGMSQQKLMNEKCYATFKTKITADLEEV